MNARAEDEIVRTITLQVNSRLPDLANLVFGAAFALTAGRIGELITVLHLVPVLSGRIFYGLVISLSVLLCFGMWNLYMWFALAVTKSAGRIRLRSDLVFLIMMLPLVFVLVYASIVFEFLRRNFVAASNSPTLSLSPSEGWSWIALGGFFFSLTLVRLILHFSDGRPAGLEAEIARRTIFSVIVGVACGFVSAALFSSGKGCLLPLLGLAVALALLSLWPHKLLRSVFR